MEDKVTLYIATHNITGKKYFGKTVKWFTRKDLQENYNGSGKYWSKHKKKHGEKDVTMEIYQICSLNESDDDYVKPIALKFSEENNIVESDKWRNLKLENGLDGGSKGYKHTDESRAKMSESAKDREHKQHSEETKAKISSSKKGIKHTPEHRKNNSEARKGITLSEEHKINIGLGVKGLLKGKTHEEIYGKEQSDRLKEHLGDLRKNRTYDEILGVEKSIETKLKKSETMKKLSNDPEHIDKIKNGMRTEEAQEKLRKTVSCPYCNKSGKMGPMSRFHFDNCKLKGIVDEN